MVVAELMHANTVVKNANVITIDEGLPRAGAFAIYGDTFGAVADEVRDAWTGPETTVLDLDGRTVVPGFYDAHCHLTIAGRDLLKVDTSPASVSSISEMVERLSEAAEKTPEGEWIQGTGYDETKLEERRHPNRWDLDEASTDHPIYVPQAGLHQGSINSKAIEIAGWDTEAPDFDGSEEFVERDEDSGELTGIVREDAKDVVVGARNVEGLVPELSRSEAQKAVKLACEKYNSCGITSIVDMSGWPAALRMFMDGKESGNLSVRVNTVVRQPYWEQLDDLNLRTSLGDEFLKIGPVKATADGAIASRTARLSEPYEDDPEDYGDLRMTQEEIDDVVTSGHEAGWQVAIHANGDRTIEMVLDAFEKALEKCPRDDHRHRIEHCTVVNEELLERIQELNLVVNPFATYLYQHGEKMEAFGDRVDTMFAHGSFLEYDIPVSGTTDNPAGVLDPLLAIQTMVTRVTNDGNVLGARQRIDVEEALKIYTLGSAYSRFEEDRKGSITAGKLADFVVLSDDPTAVDPNTIGDISVEKTFVGGKCVHSS